MIRSAVSRLDIRRTTRTTHTRISVEGAVLKTIGTCMFFCLVWLQYYRLSLSYRNVSYIHSPPLPPSPSSCCDVVVSFCTIPHSFTLQKHSVFSPHICICTYGPLHATPVSRLHELKLSPPSFIRE